LKIASTNEQSTLYWPVRFLDYTLQQVSSLTNGNWTSLTNAPYYDDGKVKVAVMNDATSDFFRLEKQVRLRIQKRREHHTRAERGSMTRSGWKCDALRLTEPRSWLSAEIPNSGSASVPKANGAQFQFGWGGRNAARYSHRLHPKVRRAQMRGE
jgi:hypothetical protein